MDRRGFTLVEVLCVVAIILLLVAVLLPSLAQARQQAQRIQCGNNLKRFGDALNYYRSILGRYPEPGDRTGVYSKTPAGEPGPRWSLDSIGDVALALVASSLARPEPMYCPASLANDPFGPRPFTRYGTQLSVNWRVGGRISYYYFVGLVSTMTFPDAEGRPTFDPVNETPGAYVGLVRRYNRSNARALLLGDRTITLPPETKAVAGSNHGRQGGCFMYTSGDVEWRPWRTLTAHPAARNSIWYAPGRKPVGGS